MVKKILNFIEEVFFALSRLSLLLMMFLITADTIGRYIFNKPIYGILEITELYLMGAVVFLSMAYTHREGGHIKIEIIAQKFNPSVRHVLDIIFGLISFFLFLGITYKSSVVTYHALINNEVILSVISWPVHISWLIVFLGTGMMSIRILRDIIRDVREGIYPKTDHHIHN